MIHVVGAGLAGLSAAVALAGRGRAVTLHEAGPAAGGRCRSYWDRELGCRIDNGNHLLLSGNAAAMDYLRTTGAAATMTGPGAPVFPFLDLQSGRRWVLRPDRGRIPWWILSPARRVPGTRTRDYLALPVLRRARGTVADALPAGALRRNLLEPLAVAALNTRADVAHAPLLWPVVAQTLLAGGASCVPLVPLLGLSESFVDPARAWLAARGGTLHTGRRVTRLHLDADRITGFGTTAGPVAADAVVLAVPPWVAADLLPDLVVPDAFEAILNVHFRAEADPGPAGFWGLVGGTAEWVFVKPGIVSVTVSAANHLVDLPATAIAARIWPEVADAVGLSGPMPQVRVVKEKRATFAATAAQEARRPPARTRWANLVLAGDWTDTGLPATIEGAIRSGHSAAEALMRAGYFANA